MIRFKHRGSFTKTEKFLTKASKLNLRSILESYGQRGVTALSDATPLNTGETAHSWGYKIVYRKGSTTVTWYNTNIENGVPVVILIQYGHATQNGSYVQGRDFINPAIQPIVDDLADNIWREVSKL